MSTRVPSIMVQGTGSHVGKTTLVAGLCRLFARRGLMVRPFKPQNMSNNAAATKDGGEIGRAQALQARAAGVEPTVHMNPVLLKPEGETGAQVIVQGKRWLTLRAAEYSRRKAELLPRVLESYARIAEGADLVLVEGAGSPAEINLRAGDIANMGFAAAARVPVMLLGDIERGGVIASLVGTKAVLSAEDNALIRGFAINKFRGDPLLFEEGLDLIASRTRWPSLGLVPWLRVTDDLPAEDLLGLASVRHETGTRGGEPHWIVAVPMLPRVANFDDLDPLRMEPTLRVVLVRPGEPIPAETRLVILPGSKSTIADLRFLREQGWDIDIHAHVRRGGAVLGLCGGYQMLGRRILDPAGVEGGGEAEGLRLLDVETILEAEKVTSPTSARHVTSGEAVHAYEIHLGRSYGPDCERPLFAIGSRGEGASSTSGRVMGTYLHGLFAADGFRRAFLEAWGTRSTARYEERVDHALDALADHLAGHLDIERILAIARAGV